MSWTAQDLSCDENVRTAVARSQAIIDRAGAHHVRRDLDWITAGQAPDDRAALYVFDEQSSAGCGCALLTASRRPLKFQLGEITLYSKRLPRWELWSEPVIEAVDGGSSYDAIAREFLDVVGQQRLRDEAALSIEGLPADGHFMRILESPDVRKAFCVLRLGAPFEHHSIDLPPSLDEYLEQLGKRSRKSVQYSARKLRKDCSDVTVECFDTIGAVDRFLRDGVTVSRKTYQWRLLGLGLRDEEALRQQLCFAADQGCLRSYILYCDGTPLAFMLGYQYQDRYYYIDVGFDPDWSDYSVGSVLQLAVLEDLYERGGRPRWFDFSTGHGTHKARFANQSVLEQNVLVFPRSWRTSVLCNAYKGIETASDSSVRILDKLGLKRRLKKAIRRYARD